MESNKVSKNHEKNKKYEKSKNHEKNKNTKEEKVFTYYDEIIPNYGGSEEIEKENKKKKEDNLKQYKKMGWI